MRFAVLLCRRGVRKRTSKGGKAKGGDREWSPEGEENTAPQPRGGGKRKSGAVAGGEEADGVASGRAKRASRPKVGHPAQSTVSPFRDPLGDRRLPLLAAALARPDKRAPTLSPSNLFVPIFST